jgi:hypothetical protein
MTNSTSNHFTCPSGGTWYVCPDAPFFVGCCSSDPCTNIDANSTSPCPRTLLSAASFDPSYYDKTEPNHCIGTVNENWYSCTGSVPPFIGCCSRNPCSPAGCPAGHLLEAAWSNARPGQFALFQDEGTGDKDGKGSGGGDELSDGAIAGIVVGGVAALVIIGALIWFFIRRRNKKAAAMSGHGHTPSFVEGEHRRMYPSPASPHHCMYKSPSNSGLDLSKSIG